MAATIEALRDFVITELHWKEDQGELTPDYPLIDNHVVDSLGLLTMLTFIEERFGIEVSDEELVPGNFATIAAIAGLIERKLQDRKGVGA